MKWIGTRISFVDDKQKTSVIITPERSNFNNAMMGAWLAMWFAIGVTLIWSFFAFELKKEEQLMIGVILVMWAYFLFRVARQFMWLLWGKEMLKLNKEGIVYKKDVRGYGKAILYYYDNMSEIEVLIPETNSLQYVWEKSPWVRGGERLQFEYFGKFIRFGRKLEEKEIKQLYQLLSSKRKEYTRLAKREERAREAEQAQD